MSIAQVSPRIRIARLMAILGGCLILIDFMWGALLVLPFDWTRPTDAVLGISFLTGLPAYVFDYRRKGRVIVFLPIAFLVRFLAELLAGSPWTASQLLALRPWIGSELLITASVLLQWSKLWNPPFTAAAN